MRQAIQQVYRFETPDELAKQGIEVIQNSARFVDATTIQAGELLIRSKTFLLTTGARPHIPPIDGLNQVPFLTYEQIFDNDRLPPKMIVVGGGPVGMELAQAYQRLGAQVSLIANRLLPKDEPEVRELMQRVFEREGIRLRLGASAVRAQRRRRDYCSHRF